MLAQQPFCFSAKGILEHDSHNQCAKHCSHRLQPRICGPKLFSPASKRNTNKQHKQQNNDDNVGSAVAITSFDFGPYLSKRTGSNQQGDLGNFARQVSVLCSGLAIDDRAEQNLPLQFGQCMQGVIDLGVQIHEGIFIRTLWQMEDLLGKGLRPWQRNGKAEPTP